MTKQRGNDDVPHRDTWHASPRPPGVFISYRRNDSSSASGRLHDWLRIAFGRDNVFQDVASIGGGRWRDKINRALERSAVCVSVIGPQWVNEVNRGRLFDADDVVRHELRTALLSNGLTILPALVEGGLLPQRQDLPEELRDLLNWKAFTLSDEGWEDDVRRLRDAVSQATGVVAAPDFDVLLRQSGQAEARIRELEIETKLQADQIVVT